MTTFSERYGYKADRSRLYQLEEMDVRLKNAIWNFLRQRYFNYAYPDDARSMLTSVWTEVAGKRIDELSNVRRRRLEQVLSWYSRASWNEVYDTLEHLLKKGSSKNRTDINALLFREGSAYRFIGDLIAPITNDDELEEVESVLQHVGPFGVASQHIRQAVDHLGDRENPDVRNTIKEAISAVESAAKVGSGDPTADIDKALKGLELHPQLAQAWKNMYNWTSDEGGLRHGKSEMSQVGLAEARYMVVACSAFVNYLIAKSSDEDNN